MKFRIFLLSLLFAGSAGADELIAPAAFLKANGYKKFEVENNRENRSQLSYQKNSLNWPVAFQDEYQTVANSMVQYQPFGDPYFHGGCDLRVYPQEKLISPVAGKLEAGHYAYDVDNKGKLIKYWKPWPQKGESLYFEIAVVDDEGNRFEFHHVDRAKLPQLIIQKLNQGGQRVQAGEHLGQTILWPGGGYDHIHYNVITADDVRVNPEWVSHLIEDHQPPRLIQVGVVNQKNYAYSVQNGSHLTQIPQSFAVAVVDHFDKDKYDHPPVWIKLESDLGLVWEWDFREKLLGPDGLFPALWSFFIQEITFNNGKSYETEGGYGMGHAVVNVPAGALVPKGSKFLKLYVGDQAGNVSSQEYSL